VPEGSPPDLVEGSEPVESSEEQNSISDESQERTPEEIEAIWKNRVSQKDKAHAAESTALRSERDELNRRLQRMEAEAQARTQGELSEADAWKAKAEDAERRLQQTEQQRVIDVRLAKYPAAAEALDESVLGAMDEGKLAALNTRLAGEGSPSSGPIDPNSAPKRNPAPPKSPNDKTVAELEADLERYGPAYVGSLGISEE